MLNIAEPLLYVVKFLFSPLYKIIQSKTLKKYALLKELD